MNELQPQTKKLDFTVEGGFLIIPELGGEIPIYNFRNLQHHEPIAKALAAGGRMLWFGGVWGAFKAVRRNTTVEEFFHKEIKPGRPQDAKVPLVARPIDAKQMFDWSKVHPDFRFLQDYSEFKKLWEAHPAFFHIGGPVLPSLTSLSDIFITTPEDYLARYEGRDIISVATIQVIFRADPYLAHLAEGFAERYAPTTMYLGVSTANRHGKEPPYTRDELLRHLAVREIPAGAVDLIVEDPWYEGYDAPASHTIGRLPLVGEEPVIKILRIGSLSPEAFEKATRLPCRPIPGAVDVRKTPGVSLDEKLAEMMKEIRENWKGEKPQIFFRT